MIREKLFRGIFLFFVFRRKHSTGFLLKTFKCKTILRRFQEEKEEKSRINLASTQNQFCSYFVPNLQAFLVEYVK